MICKISVIRGFLIAGLFAGFACSPRLVNTAGVDKVYDEEIRFKVFEDSLQFFFTRTKPIVLDTQKIPAKPFRVTLPSKPKHFQTLDDDRFKFFYGSSQLIYIVVDRHREKRDSVYTPGESKLDELLAGFKLRNNSVLADGYNLNSHSRMNKIVQKGSATILLYNIKPTNLPGYTKLVQNFRFLTETELRVKP